MDIVLSALLSDPADAATLGRRFTEEMPDLIADAEDDGAGHAPVAAIIASNLRALGAFLDDRLEHNDRRMNRRGVARRFTKVPREVSARRVILYCQLAGVCALLRGEREAIAFYRGKALYAFAVYSIHLYDEKLKPATREPVDIAALEHRLGDFFGRLTAYP